MSEQVSIQSKEFSDNLSRRIGKLMKFVDDLENEIFDKEKFSKLSRSEKLELYEVAKKSLMDDVNFGFKVQTANKEMDRDTLMLMSILQSLPNELRPVVVSKLKEVIIHKEQYMPSEDLNKEEVKNG